MSGKQALMAVLGAWFVAVLAAVAAAGVMTLIEWAAGCQMSSLLFRSVLSGIVAMWVMAKVQP